ncbi:hypothetical protein BCR34DRAFT_264380 [Clohesyomyces aquaticus]|uniref:Uncharacterized protein n=1 Tax=Clohesyomyces aquaticus TaxID=1231657 RepID=A0A1Y1ZTE7_9PLEO|nr:hypothetical protein BCR34DRAFT_264380 [Clohesyomyces aquaticus]
MFGGSGDPGGFGLHYRNVSLLRARVCVRGWTGLRIRGVGARMLATVHWRLLWKLRGWGGESGLRAEAQGKHKGDSGLQERARQDRCAVRPATTIGPVGEFASISCTECTPTLLLIAPWSPSLPLPYSDLKLVLRCLSASRRTPPTQRPRRLADYDGRFIDTCRTRLHFDGHT